MCLILFLNVMFLCCGGDYTLFSFVSREEGSVLHIGHINLLSYHLVFCLLGA